MARVRQDSLGHARDSNTECDELARPWVRFGPPPTSAPETSDFASMAVEMWFYFEESGDFGYPSAGFESNVIATVIVPDRELEKVESFVADANRRWRRSELKGKKMSPARRLQVCEFMA